MKAICRDGSEIVCGGYKAIESGVVLTEDKKRKHVIGFVPNEELQYIVPDNFDTGNGETEAVESLEDRVHELERQMASIHPEVAASMADEGEARTVEYEDATDLVDEDVEEADESSEVEAVTFEVEGEELEVEGEELEVEEAEEVEVEEVEEVEAGEVEVEEVEEVEVEEAEKEEGVVEGAEAEAAGGLEELGGLGSTYADRLRNHGYQTLEDLASADPDEVATAADVGPARARRWVEAASSRVGAA